jgi:hypothetical protein
VITPFRFRLAAALAVLALLASCDALDASKVALDIPVTQSVPVSLDFDALFGAQAGQVAPSDIDKDLTSGAITIDLAKTEPKLAQYKSHVKGIKVTAITATPTANTMVGDLPAQEMYVGPVGMTAFAQGAKLATIPPVPGGSKTAVQAAIDPADATKASAFLATLGFDVQTVTKVHIPKGQKVPGGKVALSLDLKVTVTVNPL